MGYFKQKKVITIGIVSELTGLSERQIRYYEERKLIFPDRTTGGTRKFSFEDVEMLIEIAGKIEDGHRTFEIRKSNERERASLFKEKRLGNSNMLAGQLNAHFHNQPRDLGKGTVNENM